MKWVAALITLGITFHAAAHGVSESGSLETTAPNDNVSTDAVLGNDIPAPARDPARLVINQLKVWDVGSTLRICFLDGSSTARAHIARVASEWTKYANIKFDFGDGNNPRSCRNDGTENIKISFHSKSPNNGYWSYVGKDSNSYSPSMNLDNLDTEPASLAEKEVDRLVWHEFGHALGLEHEHQSPEARCGDEIEWTAAVQYYSQCCSWTEKMVRDNLSTMLASYRLRTTPYDPTSIMHYALPAAIFKNGRNSRCFTQTNYVLSVVDKQAISTTYPDAQEIRGKRNEELLTQLDKNLGDAGVDATKRANIISAAQSTYQISTSGACSPVVTNVGGNAVITLNCK